MNEKRTKRQNKNHSIYKKKKKKERKRKRKRRAKAETIHKLTKMNVLLVEQMKMLQKNE